MKEPPSRRTLKWGVSVGSFLWFFVCRQGLSFSILQIASFSWTMERLFWPYLLKSLLDHMTSMREDRSALWSSLWPLLLGGGAFILLLHVMYRVEGFVFSRVLPTFESHVRMDAFKCVQRKSYNDFLNHFAGSLFNKINDLAVAGGRMIQSIVGLFIPVLVSFVLATVMFFWVHPLFAMVLSVWIVLHVLVSLVMARRCSHLAHVHSRARNSLSGKLVDILTNMVPVTLFAHQRFERQRLQRAQRRERLFYSFSMCYIEKMKTYLSILQVVFSVGLMVWLVLHEWQRGALSVGDVVLILGATWNITSLLWIAGEELSRFFVDKGLCQQALRLVSSREGVVEGTHPLKVTSGRIVFENVRFFYTDTRAFSHEGELSLSGRVGLVGLSGSGKTTFAHLILRLFSPQEGRLLIDGQDIAKCSASTLLESITMIPQEPSLFHRSLMENIRYGRLSATDEEVFMAARKACCHDFIMAFPQGYRTLVGERGMKLSGGQRQRIALARAFLKTAPIVIFDEATSALDSVTEGRIQDNLEELTQGRTSLVIAHRLSTLSNMERILVFEKGRIVEDGSHEALLKRGDHYATLWAKQIGGFLPGKIT